MVDPKIDNIIERITALKESVEDDRFKSKSNYSLILDGEIIAYDMVLHIIFEEMEGGD